MTLNDTAQPWSGTIRTIKGVPEGATELVDLLEGVQVIQNAEPMTRAPPIHLSGPTLNWACSCPERQFWRGWAGASSTDSTPSSPQGEGEEFRKSCSSCPRRFRVHAAPSIRRRNGFRVPTGGHGLPRGSTGFEETGSLGGRSTRAAPATWQRPEESS